jgi:hypothetical protein
MSDFKLGSNFQLGPLQTKWLEALESGEYKQQRAGWLQTEDGFCCLGVANVVCNLGEVSYTDLTETYDKMGLINYYGDIKDGGLLGKHSLAGVNDGTSLSFKEIAQYIRENPKKVFLESK